MSTAVEAKLTKKQRKSVAFRERKKKGKGPSDAGILDVPEADDQDLLESAEYATDNVELPAANVDKKDKGKAVVADEEQEIEHEKASTFTKLQKRKRDDDGDMIMKVKDDNTTSVEAKPKKKRKAEDGEDEPGRRKILFLGNLKFTTTKDSILKHFASCDPLPDVRLLTPKPRPGAPPPNKAIKSKGCAFLEFSNRVSLQEGLRLHHSVLDGRQINVELTAGGGGNSTSRVAKLKERNKELHGQRVKAADKRKMKKIEDKIAPEQEMAQLMAGKRYSATSGVDQAPVIKRTWTVGDEQETETHRGGVKHNKSNRKRGTRVKSQASGMNAIPVG